MNFPLHASSPSASTRKIPFIPIVGLFAALYFARDVCLPLALAVLISFLLAPLIRGLERWRLGRVPAVIVAVFLGFSVIGVVGYTIAGQVIDLAYELETYKTNLQAKIASLKTTKDSPWNRASGTLRELSAEFSKKDPPRRPLHRPTRPLAPQLRRRPPPVLPSRWRSSIRRAAPWKPCALSPRLSSGRWGWRRWSSSSSFSCSSNGRICGIGSSTSPGVGASTSPPKRWTKPARGSAATSSRSAS